MTFSMFLILLMFASVITGLATEGVKGLMDERGRAYKSNMLAGVVALIVGVIIAAGYLLIYGLPITGQLIWILVALVLLSWLCAMVGYDKVVQAIKQFHTSLDEIDTGQGTSTSTAETSTEAEEETSTEDAPDDGDGKDDEV